MTNGYSTPIGVPIGLPSILSLGLPPLINPYPALDLDFINNPLDSRITFSRASTATFFNSLGVLTTASSGVARFDYNPSTLQPRGLLIEEQRTNSIRNNTMQGAVAGTPGTLPTNWSFSGAAGLTTTIVGAGVANGVQYLDVRYNGTTSGPFASVVFDAVSGLTTATSYTLSCYLAIVGGSIANLGTPALITRYNLSAGGFTNISTSFSLAGLTNNVSANRIVSTGSTVGTLSGTGTAFLLLNYASGVPIDITLRIGMPQLELGAFATSVIPTSGTALTRNADVASMTGTNFSSWYSASEGTFVFNGVTNAATGGFLTADNGSAGNYMRFGRGFNKASFLISNTSGTQADLFSVADITLGTQFKLAATYKVNDAALSLNGAAAVTDTLVTLPDAADRLRIGLGLYTTYLNGHIQRIAYYPVKLASSQLQALTA